MQSGVAKTKDWILEIPPSESRELDPLLGWCGSGDTQSQVSLCFESKEAALTYAKSAGLEVTIVEPQSRKPNIRAKGYGENFTTNRRGGWTH